MGDNTGFFKEIINNLTSSFKDKALSALQGKILNEKKLDKPTSPNNTNERVILADGTTKLLSEIMTNIVDATGDLTFTKMIVARPDKTLGIINKNENVPWTNLTLANPSKFSANSYVKYRVKDNSFCLHGHLTFTNGATYARGETICDLPFSLVPPFAVPNNSFMIPISAGIINDYSFNQLVINFRPAYAYRLHFAQFITQGVFNLGTSFYVEIKL